MVGISTETLSSIPQFEKLKSKKLYKSPFSIEERTERRQKINDGEITEVTIWDLNNFSAKVPGGSERQQLLNFPELLKRSNKDFHNSDSQKTTPKSEKYLNQTTADFYREVEKALEAVGLSLGNIIELNKLISKEGGSSLARKTQNHLNEILLPVYWRLRSEGYCHDELII